QERDARRHTRQRRRRHRHRRCRDAAAHLVLREMGALRSTDGGSTRGDGDDGLHTLRAGARPGRRSARPAGRAGAVPDGLRRGGRTPDPRSRDAARRQSLRGVDRRLHQRRLPGGRARSDRGAGPARRRTARRPATRHCARPSPPPRGSKPRSGTWAGQRGSDRMRTDITGPTSRIYFSQRLRLHYVDWGNPDAPPLLLLHGGRDHCRNWDWVADALRGEWHVIAPDLRGHGDSAWSQAGNCTMAAYVYDLAQLVHQQKLAPVTIVAHSLGGNISLRYAGLYPDHVRKLVAIE